MRLKERVNNNVCHFHGIILQYFLDSGRSDEY